MTIRPLVPSFIPARARAPLASMEVDGEDPPGPSGRATTEAPPRRWNQRGAPDEFAGPPPSGGHETFWLSDGSDEDDGGDEDYDDDELDRGARAPGRAAGAQQTTTTRSTPPRWTTRTSAGWRSSEAAGSATPS